MSSRLINKAVEIEHFFGSPASPPGTRCAIAVCKMDDGGPKRNCEFGVPESSPVIAVIRIAGPANSAPA